MKAERAHDTETTRVGSGCVISFLGGTETVTGSRFLVETPRSRVLVDCGLFQGAKSLRLRNWDVFPVKPRTIDAVVISHAHLDHVGYLPALVRDGFRGRAYATEGTARLGQIILPDSGRLHEEEARYANRKGYSRHRPALPLYTEGDAYRAAGRFHVIGLDDAVAVTEDVRVTLRRAGHILGSSSIVVDTPSGSILFSGDLGRPRHPLLLPPERRSVADVVLVESTYGNRRHDDASAMVRFRSAIARTIEREGAVIIPSFAVDRTEVVLHHLRELIRTGAFPGVPIYVDSPMALDALAVYRRAIREGWPEVRPEITSESVLDPGNLHEVRTVEDSKAVNGVRGPIIIVAASGMATGGRVLHHLIRRLPDRRNTVILAGYQAEGTRGRSLADGARTLKMLGHHVPVRAEVVDVGSFSVHADGDEVLQWLASNPHPPEMTYVVHGEASSAQTLASRIDTELDWPAVVPRCDERVSITP